jgi:hypothetical protein
MRDIFLDHALSLKDERWFKNSFRVVLFDELVDMRVAIYKVSSI